MQRIIRTFFYSPYCSFTFKVSEPNHFFFHCLLQEFWNILPPLSWTMEQGSNSTQITIKVNDLSACYVHVFQSETRLMVSQVLKLTRCHQRKHQESADVGGSQPCLWSLTPNNVTNMQGYIKMDTHLSTVQFTYRSTVKTVSYETFLFVGDL